MNCTQLSAPTAHSRVTSNASKRTSSTGCARSSFHACVARQSTAGRGESTHRLRQARIPQMQTNVAVQGQEEVAVVRMPQQCIHRLVA
jgi:hypothetical protein